MNHRQTPPMEPETSEADAEQLEREQGEAYGRALQHIVDPDGRELGTEEHPPLWHPMIYHHGRNWQLPVDGAHTVRVRVDPPTFMRHDEINGKRFTEPAGVESLDVHVKRGS